MNLKKKTLRQALHSLCAGLLALSFASAGAAEIGVELEVGVGQTDNITRASGTVADPTMDDTVYDAGIAVTLEHESARTNVDMRGSILFHDYQDGPYDNETLPALDVAAIFRITDQSLSWFFNGNVGQQSVDPFEPVTPDNRQNFSYLTTGPSLLIPMGRRFSLRTDLSYSSIDYEEQPFDNKRQGAQVSLVRQISPTRSLSLNVRGERTDFDLDALFAPIDRYDAFLRFSTEGSRNEVSVDLGWSVTERSSEQSEDPLVNIDWTRQMSEATSLGLSVGTRVSDSAESFRGNQQDSINIGDVQNRQSIDVPFREDYAGITIGYSASRTDLRLGSRWVKEDYLDTLATRDRNVVELYTYVSRQLGRAWAVGLDGTHFSYDYESLGREDKDFNVGASLTWRQLRTIEIVLRFDRLDRTSTVAAGEFTENRVYLGFRYVPDIGR